jgi:hypothetical protein
MFVHRKNLWLLPRIVALEYLEFWMDELSQSADASFDSAMNGQTLSGTQSIDQV